MRRNFYSSDKRQVTSDKRRNVLAFKTFASRASDEACRFLPSLVAGRLSLVAASLVACHLSLVTCLPASAERIKDIVDIKGVRGNPLQGYGVVVGLAGTGDDSALAKRMLANILRKQNLVVEPKDLGGKNIAAVMVRAELGPFTREGAAVDVTVSTMDKSTSLQGGTLLVTELNGADGQVYAVAEGAISVGGFAAAGENARVSKNHATVGAIPNGATVEKEETATFVDDKTRTVTLLLRNADFTTAQRIAAAVNESHAEAATADDAGSVTVRLPAGLKRSEISEFIAAIGQLTVEVDNQAVVVIDEKTGTIVVGENVMISTVAISQGNLSIVTKEIKEVSQPLPFSGGRTEVTTDTNLQVVEDAPAEALRVVNKTVSVAELARALNAMGVTPRDLVSIFRTLKAQGALQAQLKTM